MTEELGPHIGKFPLTSLPPGIPATGGVRLWLPPDLMFALRISAGTLSTVGLAPIETGELRSTPLSLQTVFQQCFNIIAAKETKETHIGDLVVVTELWPAPRLPKGQVAASPVLRDALGRPDPGSHLSIFGLPPLLTNSPGSEMHCTAIYLRQCETQGSFSSYPATLPPEDDTQASAEGSSSRPGSSPATPVSATTRNTQSAQSPGMRRAGRQPVALSPAMRITTSTPPPALLSGDDTPCQLPIPQTPQSTRLASSAGTSSSGKGASSAALHPLQGGALAALLHSPGNEQVRRLVENLMLRMLCGRRLLPGNFVAAPILGHQAVFRIEHISYQTEGLQTNPDPSHGSGLTEQQEQQGAPAYSSPAGCDANHPMAVGLSEALLAKPISLRAEVRLLAADQQFDAGVPGVELGWLPATEGAGYARAAAQAAADAIGGGVEGAAATAASRAAAAGAIGSGMAFSGLGGSAGPKQALCELVVLPLKAPHIFRHYQVTPPQGVLLHGPPGTGKTVLARAAATAAGANLFVINGPDVVSEYFGESESGLRGVFAAAKAMAPSVIFIDELDAIAPSRSGSPGLAASSGGGGGVSGRLVTALLLEMDGLQGLPVVMVAATNRQDALDPALRRPGRFDREVEVGVPSPSDRREVLCMHLARMRHTLTTQQIDALADAAHGFVAADLAALCNEAALAALRRQILSGHSALTCDGKDGLVVSAADFATAENRVRPSAMREISTEIPKVRWEDVGGLDDVKERLKEAVEWPFKSSQALGRLGAQPPKGILLHGPPGCSKTLLARAVASQAKLNFVAVKGPELYSKYVGESEKAIATLFRRARTASPSIVFIDEIDGLASSREQNGDGSVTIGDRVLSQLLQEMDGLQVHRNVIVIGATNRLGALDPALVRPGRFDQLLYIPPPSKCAREAIFSVHTRNTPMAPDVDLSWLATMTEGYSGADIMALCKEACMAALEIDISTTQVGMREFLKAFHAFQPSFSCNVA